MAQQETSALFSLKELMRLEERRVEEEAELARQRVEAAERARQEAERSARERALARQRAEENRRREAQAKERDEALRIEGVRAAEIERARAFALERARSEALLVQRGRDEKLALLNAGEAKKRLQWASLLALAACLAIVAGGAALYFGKWKPAADLRAFEMQSIINDQRARREDMQRTLDDQIKKAQAIQKQLQEQQSPPKEAAPAPNPGRGFRAPRPPKPSPAKPTPCTCDPHDPLCGCFAR